MSCRTVIISNPAQEPVTLDEAKLHLRVDDDDDDSLIEATVKAARRYCEIFTRRSFVQQTWRMDLDCFPFCIVIEVPKSPLEVVNSINYLDASNVEQTLDLSTVTIDTTTSTPARIVLNEGETWPATINNANAVKIEFVSGYSDTGECVPPTINQAILLLVGHWYENREAVVDGNFKKVPMAVESLHFIERIMP